MLSHNILLRKLKLYNFSEKVLKWTISYLNFRSQYVSIGTRNSRYSSVTSGVPQGSVLGPIFYVIYMNELPSLMNDNNCEESVHDDNTKLFTDYCNKCGQMPTYADDSTIVISTANRFDAQDKIITITNRVKSFLSSNSLSLNLGKTEIVETMVRQKRARLPGLPPQLSVQKPDGTFKVILAKESCRLLGANLNRDATWSHHLELGEKPLCKALRSTLGILTHLSKNLPLKSRLLLANGLFISRLLYLLPMWGGLPQKETKKIQILLNKCARMVLKKSRKTRTRSLMVGCGWLYLKELVIFHSSVQMYKIVTFGTPVNLRNKLEIDNDRRITTIPGRLKISRDSFRWRSTRVWNELPDHVINADKLSAFKKLLRQHLIDGRADIAARQPPDRD